MKLPTNAWQGMLLGAAIGFIVWITVFEAVAHASTPAPKPTIHKLAPPVSCTSKNRMDIFIDEDNIMWACECEMLQTGNICRWQVIGGVDSPEARRFLRSHPLSRLYVKRHGYTIAPMIVRMPHA